MIETEKDFAFLLEESLRFAAKGYVVIKVEIVEKCADVLTRFSAALGDLFANESAPSIVRGNARRTENTPLGNFPLAMLEGCVRHDPGKDFTITETLGDLGL